MVNFVKLMHLSDDDFITGIYGETYGDYYIEGYRQRNTFCSEECFVTFCEENNYRELDYEENVKAFENDIECFQCKKEI